MKLFEAGRIGGLTIKNRVVMAPMGTGGLQASDGTFSQRGIDYYVTRAKGGVGLIIAANARVSRVIEQLPIKPLVPSITIDSAIHVDSLSQLADGVHDYGAKIAMQMTLGHGRVAHRYILTHRAAVAPSAVPCLGDPNIMARELTIAEIERMLQDFEVAAQIASTAGIDAIQIHGHEGYLLDQFTTALWNRRTDQYGGDLNNRLRFPVEIIKAIRRGAGKEFPIIYRYGLTHYLEGGRDIEEGLEMARRLQAEGVDALEIDAGCYETWYWPHPTLYQPPGCMVNLAEMVKKVVSIPVIAVGKLGNPALAENVLREEKADFISLGRPLLADPEWPNKVRQGRAQEICPCIGCNEGCMKRITNKRKYLSCAVNPRTGAERDLAIQPAEEKKTVLVVGGGVGGMEAARVAAVRGHRVSLWEKRDALGGHLIAATLLPYKTEHTRLIEYLSHQISKLGVSIQVGREATVNTVRDMKPDVIFIATGSTPVIPEIPGVDKDKVITAIDLLSDKKPAGKTVAVIGGGTTGCETALWLAQSGKKVTIIESLDSVARDMFKADRMHLLKLLAESNVDILTESAVLKINDECVEIADKGGKTQTISCDTAVLAAGRKSDRQLLDALGESVPEVHVIGDAVKPREVLDAIWEGFRFARLI